MKIEQLYTGCLAEAAYYIESKGEVAIIDPLRETTPYIEMAEKNGAKIKYVLETHFHADFVSGHLDLAKKTGATIVYGPTAQPNFTAHVAKDGEELPLGNIKIRVLHTPGHTMESSSYLLIDENGKEYALFSGDTLFIGDVGRPDLAVKSDLSREDLAGFLFESLRNKIMTLPDDVIVYPNHGAGSACGKNMSKETWDTLGNQKKENYALRADMTKAEFVKAVTTGLVAPPQYFPKNAVMNKMGYESIDDVLQRGLKPLSASEFKTIADDPSTLLLDTRSKEDFPNEYIKGALFIGVDETFAPWVGALISDLKTPILIVADSGKEEEVVTRLARVGYDNAIGFLNGGMQAWKSAGFKAETMEEVEANQLATLFETDSLHVLDVRKQSEYDSEHVVGFINSPLDSINMDYAKLDPNAKYYVHCAGGFRSVIACSLLKRYGINNVVNVKGGFKAIKNTSLPISDFVEPSTML